MDFMAIFNQYFAVVVVLACLLIGYTIKTALDFIPNKYIPTILGVAGAVVNCIYAGGPSLETIVYGAFMGLASTGLHQAFTRFVEGTDNGTEEED